jgi:2-polyprenyl-3-methyl-5-hydroxy-6-metoxy-1,4-benzoquinol methylase
VTDFGAFSDKSTGSTDVYKAYIEKDPHRRGLHYPAVISELGALRNKRILDIGTGDAQLPRLLASSGASVVGYDHNPNMIRQGLEHPDTGALGIKLVEAKPQTFHDSGQFDAVTSVMVLNYATDLDDLTAFFRCAHRHLIAGGRFISIVLNPHFAAFAADFFIRRFTKLDKGNLVRVEFLNEMSHRVEQKAEAHQYTAREFEHAAVEGGTVPEREPWKRLRADPQALAAKGEHFWHPCHQHEPFVMFLARKG